MLGIVLCGGKSLRMGADKGLLAVENKNWAQIAFDKLSALNIPVQLSVSAMQKNSYHLFFADELLITDAVNLEIKGPLLGVLSAHRLNPNQDLLVLACDLPLMEIKILKELVALKLRQNTFEAYIFTNNGEPEPLCAIYTAKGLEKIFIMQQQNKLSKYSMKFMLSQLQVCEIVLPETDKLFFKNFNAHAELNGL